jgi:diaminohydroxyphosphoribosylaminopyrimidine deaminase/5-amino-6-(5-phosphoribosylamino)uracil reductase
MLKDQDFIKKTFTLAKKGLGSVSPNPLVGALIVKDGRIIGEGYHKTPGTHHAEVNAILNAKESVAGGTLYCNLEPCCHTKKRTPPCTDFIISKNIKKVIFANLDPNPLVSGKGMKKLQDAGVIVHEGILKERGEKLNEVFFKYISTGIPFVHVKLAQTLDGKLATQTGDSKWITDQQARTQAHKLRLSYDGVLVGRKTLNADDPRLDIRMGWDTGGKVPFRIIVGHPGKMKKNSRIFNDNLGAKTLIVTGKEKWKQTKDKTFFKLRGIEVLTVREVNGNLDLREALMSLGMFGITSILVEGGQKIVSSFIEQKLFDKMTIFIAPKILGRGQGVYDRCVTSISEAISFSDINFTTIGDQIVFEGYSKENSCLQG